MNISWWTYLFVDFPEPCGDREVEIAVTHLWMR